MSYWPPNLDPPEPEIDWDEVERIQHKKFLPTFRFDDLLKMRCDVFNWLYWVTQ